MEPLSKLIIILCIGALGITPSITYGQKVPKCVKVATIKRPVVLVLNLDKLNRFSKNFEELLSFDEMKTAKWELAYYLLAKEKDGNRIFAFELEQKGKRLFLNKFYPVQTCDMGDLSLDTFIKNEGRISGCRLGNHSFKQLQKKG